MITKAVLCSIFYRGLRQQQFLYVKITIFGSTVKPVYNGHPWDPKKVAVVQSWLVFTGFSIKIGIKSSLAGLRLAVVDRWPLLRGGR